MANEKYAGELARWEKGIEVDAPTTSTAAEMEATTIGVPPPKPKRKDFVGAANGGAKAFEEALAQYEIELEEFYKTSAMRPVATATGSIEEDSKAIATQGDATLSGDAKATAATRDTIAEEAALAGTEEFTEDADSTVKAVTGKVATVEEWRDSTAAEAREGELPVKPTASDFSGPGGGKAFEQATEDTTQSLKTSVECLFQKEKTTTALLNLVQLKRNSKKSLTWLVKLYSVKLF